MHALNPAHTHTHTHSHTQPPGLQVPSCPALLQGWLSEVGNYFKSQDGRHLLTVGEEGEWG
jgi:hypothetical protein